METEAVDYQTPLLKMTKRSHPEPLSYYVVRYLVGIDDPLKAEYLRHDGTWGRSSPSYWSELSRVIAVLAEFEIDVM